MLEWAQKILDNGGLELVQRAELETLRRAAQMPTRRRSSGKTVKEIPLNEKLKRALARAPKVPNFRRGLYDCAQLAYMLQSLGYCHDAAEFEEALEGDGSEVPKMLGEALKAVGEALIAMTAEEVHELLADAEGREEEAGEEMGRGLTATITASGSLLPPASSDAAGAWHQPMRDNGSLPADSSDKLEEAPGAAQTPHETHRTLGEKHAELSDHIDDAREAHSDATTEHHHVGAALEAAHEAANSDNPKDARGHIKRAMDHYSQAEGHIAEVAAAQHEAHDRCEDVGDAQRAMGRAVQSAQRCVRSVVEHLQATDPESEGADQLEDEEKVSARAALAARRARRKAALAAVARTPLLPAAAVAHR